MIIKDALVFKDGQFEKGDVCTEGGLISQSSSDGRIIDAHDLYLLPGFVDLHFHGADNADFMDGDLEQLIKLAEYEAKNGITSIAPASMTMSRECILKSIRTAVLYKKLFESKHKACASLEGIYLEGPFVSEKKLGAQNPDYVLKPSKAALKEFLDSAEGLIKVVVIAPEKEGALELIESFKDRVVFSLGHSDSDYETATQAMNCGLSQLTHTFNAMNPFLHRKPGPIGAACDSENTVCEIITDGIHVHSSWVRALFKLKNAESIVMVSDSMMATGLCDGVYSLGGQRVMVKGRRATLENGVIAGSASNLYDCFKNAVLNMNIPLGRAVLACTQNPARVLKIDHFAGKIEKNYRADLLIADRELNLKGVILRGELLYLL
ncbi:MAG: N-acetylglucosamine-6-phosphate deacetylase [Succinivibrio sp.]